MAEQNFDVVLIDFQMPEMDGVTLARKIRQRTQTPLILLSSSGELITGEDASLFQIQISKPIRHSSLFHALLKIIGPELRQPLKIAEKNFDSTMATKHPLRILLAEDNSGKSEGWSAHAFTTGIYRRLGSGRPGGADCCREDPIRSDPYGHSNAQHGRDRCGSPHPEETGRETVLLFLR